MSVFAGISRKQVVGAILLLAFTLVLYFSLRVIIYFAVSVAFTIALSPIMELLDRVEIRKFKLPDWLKAIIGLVSIYAFFYIIFLLIVPPLMRELSAISELSMSEIYKNLEQPIQNIEKWADNLGIKPVGYASNREYVMAKMSEYLNISNVTGTITGLVSVLGNLLVALFSISFITFFLLKERRIAVSIVLAFTPDSTTERMARVLSQIKYSLQRYIVGIILQISLITIIVSFGLNFFNINNAFVIGFFAGIINVIPYIGPLIGTAVGTLVAFGTTPGLMAPEVWQMHLIKVLSVFVVVQLMDNFIFQPLIFSRSVNAHPLEIFFVILIAGNLFGIVGMIVAVPSYSVFRVIGREFLSEYKWIRSITQER
ncbi:AI-2E family transporter [Thermaurantimonas aggregans]|uniref:AI-2E family transporter n=1 Tax=Thermaurantimonas aggregans TaxID=2173829 RepID=A0A401XMG2_9FLAO|nr:AI-2E family transporter [Thermaurantimonas aggregans]MCX8148388.1 AI-2E family transporter [Thermaurantimonas aggregans]GCD78191.1 AI-2E family transporter [Thermaurantimonas aggregans]